VKSRQNKGMHLPVCIVQALAGYKLAAPGPGGFDDDDDNNNNNDRSSTSTQ
jgi:hypothetical protein